MEIKEVVQKLVGSIIPAGESHKDTERFENLKTMCELVDSLIYDIYEVSKDKNRHETSMRVMGEYADRFLNELKTEL